MSKNTNHCIKLKYRLVIGLIIISITCACKQSSKEKASLIPATIKMESSIANEVQMFLGEASAGRNNPQGYPVGERHSIIVFSRQAKGAEPDWAAATDYVEKGGWLAVDLQKAAAVDPSTLERNVDGKRAYNEAMMNGRSMIVFSEPLKDNLN